MASGGASKAARWTGWGITALPVLMLLFSGGVKFTRMPEVIKANTDLGIPESRIMAIGIVELACVVVYLIPQTAGLGAVLLTGYLGGATAIHVRSETPFFFPVVMGVLVWLGLYLREPRLRSLLPLRR